MPAYPNNISGIQSQLLKETLPVGWPWRFLTIMVIVFLAVVLSYFGLEFGYKPYLEKQLNTVQNQINDATNAIVSDQSRNYLGFYSQILNIETLLKTHTNPSAFLPFLASSTNPMVSYTAVKVTVPQDKIDISGAASSYAVLASQLQAYENSPEVTRTVLEGSQAAAGAVSFQVTLYVNPELFTYNEMSASSSANISTTTQK